MLVQQHVRNRYLRRILKHQLRTIQHFFQLGNSLLYYYFFVKQPRLQQESVLENIFLRQSNLNDLILLSKYVINTGLKYFRKALVFHFQDLFHLHLLLFHTSLLVLIYRSQSLYLFHYQNFDISFFLNQNRKMS